MATKRNIPMSQRIELARRLRFNLEAGITLVESFRQQAQRGKEPLRSACADIQKQLQKGISLQEALEKNGQFPPLFVTLAGVGEHSGHLPEIFAALERYYTQQLQLNRKFLSRMIMPAAQFVMAVLIVSLVIWVLGILNSSAGKGLFGLSGFYGGLTFSAIAFAVVASAIFLARWFYFRSKRSMALQQFLLSLPGIGSCLLAMAMNRFTMALQYTLDSGMSIIPALRLSLDATDNPVFQNEATDLAKRLRSGKSLSLALAKCRVFPQDFHDVVAVAEESGSLPEVMEKQSRYYLEESERKLALLSQMATWGIWLCYAIFMIVLILSMASMYFNALKL